MATVAPTFSADAGTMKSLDLLAINSVFLD
jgi:hypothetical protein